MNGYHPDPNRSQIIEVWADNLEEEFSHIRDVVEQYHYIAIDTEFPGVVNKPRGNSLDYNYQTVKCNVDVLKVIQLGITFADSHGNLPLGTSTWQFNFSFNLECDRHAKDSIEFLKGSGIDFDKHQEKGVSLNQFGELIISSGLVMNQDVKWISFHGCYDFGYLLKLLTCTALPQHEAEFFDLLHDFFPALYDIKFLLMNNRNPNFNGGLSLQKIADHLNVVRIGRQHQAGSDSLVTCHTFFKLMEVYFDNQIDDSCYSGFIYGVGRFTFSKQSLNGGNNAIPSHVNTSHGPTINSSHINTHIPNSMAPNSLHNNIELKSPSLSSLNASTSSSSIPSYEEHLHIHQHSSHSSSYHYSNTTPNRSNNHNNSSSPPNKPFNPYIPHTNTQPHPNSLPPQSNSMYAPQHLHHPPSHFPMLHHPTPHSNSSHYSLQDRHISQSILIHNQHNHPLHHPTDNTTPHANSTPTQISQTQASFNYTNYLTHSTLPPHYPHNHDTHTQINHSTPITTPNNTTHQIPHINSQTHLNNGAISSAHNNPNSNNNTHATHPSYTPSSLINPTKKLPSHTLLSNNTQYSDHNPIHRTQNFGGYGTNPSFPRVFSDRMLVHEGLSNGS